MQKLFQAVITDIRNRENIDLYLSVLIGFIVVILDIFGFVRTDVTIAAVLAVLTLITIGMANDRKTTQLLHLSTTKLSSQVEDLISSFHVDNFFEHGIYYSLGDRFDKAESEIWLLGRIGYNTINNNYSALEQSLNRGCQIRMIICSEDVVGSQAKWSRTGKTREDYRREWKQSIMMATQLLDSCRNKQGMLEVRVIPVLYSYSGTYIDPRSEDGLFSFTPYSFPSRRDYGWEFKANYATAPKICGYLKADFEKLWEKAEKLLPPK